MHQIEEFNIIKDKNLKNLYQIVYQHLKYIDDAPNIEALHTYKKYLLAYHNGYTSDQKLFKKLQKYHLLFKEINISWLGVFLDYKINYFDQFSLKSYDNLITYAKLQSKFSFLFLITDKLAKNHLNIISSLGIIDILSDILLNDEKLNSQSKINYPEQLLFDFNVEISLNKSFLKNDKYIGLWEYIHFKVRTEINLIKPLIITFLPHEIELIKLYINDIISRLNERRNFLISLSN
ncbi:hypothetical protein [Acholeplasma granularum]|uniref:hypothetical protein n=1 Tax=Acholeplasma granularum TaxID=264635 RepID=UPI00046F81AA|nr:hypothetical protein [Acholeplasma granularum]